MLKKSIIIVIALLFLLSGCGKSDKNIETTTDSTETITKEIETTTNYIKQEEIIEVEPFDGFSELRQSHKVDIEIPEYAMLGDICVYGDKVYYSMDYNGALMMNMISVGDDYTSKIYEYDIKTKKHSIMYETDNGMIRLWYVSTNGSKIAWVEHNEESSEICVLDIDNGYKEIIYCNETLINKIVVTDKYVLWIDVGSEIENSQSVYRYDFDTKATVEIIKGISMSSSKNVVSYNNALTIYENKEDESIISVYDYEGVKIYQFQSKGKILKAICDLKMCVWINSEIDGEGYEINVLDIRDNKKYKLEKDIIESIALYNNYLVLTTDNQLFSYSLGDTKEKCITAPNGNELYKYIYTDAYGNISYICKNVIGRNFYEKDIVSVNIIK